MFGCMMSAERERNLVGRNFDFVIVVVQMTDEQGLMNIQILKIIIMNTQCMTKDECY